MEEYIKVANEEEHGKSAYVELHEYMSMYDMGRKREREREREREIVK